MSFHGTIWTIVSGGWVALQMARQITEITRRDLGGVLARIDWWGRLEEIAFLFRLYPLDDLPSYDPRYKTAEQDIYQHRISNSDWPRDWVFSDERFGLANGDDEDLLRFLTEMLHPAVRREDESESIIEEINPLLRADGYQIVQNGSISGRPKYAWERVDAEPSSFHKHFTKNIAPLIATISELAQQDGSDLEVEVLRKGQANLGRAAQKVIHSPLGK